MNKITIGYGVSIGDNNGQAFFLYDRDKKELYATSYLDTFNVIDSEAEARAIAEKETDQSFTIVRFVGTDKDYTVEDLG